MAIFNRVPSYIAARIGCAAVIASILFLDFFGRYLEKNFPVLIDLIPYLALALLAAALIVAAHSRPGISIDGTILRPLALTLAACAAGAVLCELLVTMRIERIHFVKYALLSLLASHALASGTLGRRVAAALLFAAAVGTADESMQYFIPNRIFAFWDMVINWAGAAFGIILSLCLRTFSAAQFLPSQHRH